MLTCIGWRKSGQRYQIIRMVAEPQTGAGRVWANPHVIETVGVEADARHRACRLADMEGVWYWTQTNAGAPIPDGLPAYPRE